MLGPEVRVQSDSPTNNETEETTTHGSSEATHTGLDVPTPVPGPSVSPVAEEEVVEKEGEQTVKNEGEAGRQDVEAVPKEDTPTIEKNESSSLAHVPVDDEPLPTESEATGEKDFVPNNETDAKPDDQSVEAEDSPAAPEPSKEEAEVTLDSQDDGVPLGQGEKPDVPVAVSERESRHSALGPTTTDEVVDDTNEASDFDGQKAVDNNDTTVQALREDLETNDTDLGNNTHGETLLETPRPEEDMHVDGQDRNQTSEELVHHHGGSEVVQDNGAQSPEGEHAPDSNGSSGDPSSHPPTLNGTLPPGAQPTREKSVFLRLSNRIRDVEENMSLFSSYLDQISTRWV